jgi:hypothetical protein
MDRSSRSFQDDSLLSVTMPCEIRLDEMGVMDEIVARPLFVHIERMAGGHFWMSLWFRSGGVHVNFVAKKSQIGVSCEEDLPRPGIHCASLSDPRRTRWQGGP